jgi:hypothetical protein
VAQVPGLEQEVLSLAAKLGAVERRLQTLDATSRTRVESMRRLDGAGLQDFPAMLDEAIVSGVLRIEEGDKRIMALLLESMAMALLAKWTNQLVYRPELMRFSLAVRLQPSAKSALQLVRGPGGMGKGSAATPIDSGFAYNILGLPGERTFSRIKAMVNPHETGEAGIQKGKIMATVLTEVASLLHADETDLRAGLSEDKQLKMHGDVSFLDFVEGAPDLKAIWQEKLYLLAGPANRYLDDANEKTRAPFLKSVRLVEAFVVEHLPLLATKLAEHTDSDDKLKAKFHGKQLRTHRTGDEEVDSHIALHQKQERELVQALSLTGTLKKTMERVEAYSALSEMVLRRVGEAQQNVPNFVQCDRCDAWHPLPRLFDVTVRATQGLKGS